MREPAARLQAGLPAQGMPQGPDSLGDSWEQSMTLGQSYLLPARPEQEKVQYMPPPAPNFAEVALCTGEGLRVLTKGLG